MSADRLLLARLEAIERALGLPRRVSLLVCRECGYRVAELRRRRNRGGCPRCGRIALVQERTVTWPPPGRVDDGDES